MSVSDLHTLLFTGHVFTELVQQESTTRKMAKTFELNTFRTMLRAAEAGDVEPLNVAFSDPEVMRYWSGSKIWLSYIVLTTLKVRAPASFYRA